MNVQIASLAEALLGPFTDPASRTWWPALALTGLVALLLGVLRRPAGWTAARLWAVLRHPSNRLDVQLTLARQLVRLLLGAPTLAGAWWVATHGVRWLDGALGVPTPPDLPRWLVAAAYSLGLFLAWDLSRFLLHLALHRVPGLWAFHQVHHSAEVLTPLTFHRIHPVESVLYQLRGVLTTGAVAGLFYWVFRDGLAAWTLFGVPASGVLLNLAMGNLRHSHVWIRFPAPVERWLLSPAQHQVHHSADPAHFDKNLGTWLAVWDRLAGTLVSEAAPPARYGLPAGTANHGHDLLSAWFGPLRGSVPVGVLALALVVAGVARAEDPAAEEEADEGAFGMEIIVTGDDGTPRVAGSAQEIDEEALERFEYDDIEKVLAQVPGVTTRGEDGYGLRPNIGIRGANSDRSAKVTLMEDGVLLAPAPYAAPAAYYFPMSTRVVGVEVFKGPAATRHGPQTVAGAINLLTRPVPQDTDYAADLAGGLYGTAKGHGWVGTRGDRWGVLLEGVHLRSSGFKELDGGGPTGFNRSEGMLKTRFEAAPGHTLELKLGYARERSHETYLGLTRSDAAATPYRRYAASRKGLMEWGRSQGELAWHAELGDAVQLYTVAYHHRLARSWLKLNGLASGLDVHELLQAEPDAGQGAFYLDVLRGQADTDPSVADQALLIGTNDRTFQAAGLQSVVRWSVYGGEISSDLEAGVRLHADDVWRLHTQDPYDMLDGQLVKRDAPTETTNDSYATARALAVHVHDDLRLGTVHLLPGARLEQVWTDLEGAGIVDAEAIGRTTLLPGLGVLVDVGSWVDVFAGAYQGFSPVAPGQPVEVGPEKSWNYEAGARFAQGDLHVEAVGFINDYANITGDCTFSGGCGEDLVGRQFNGGRAWIEGAELVAGTVAMLPGAFTLPIQATGAWTETWFQNAFHSDFPQYGDVQVGDALPYVPRFQGSLNTALVHPRWEVGLGASARSGMLDQAGPLPPGELDVPALFLLDAEAKVKLGRRCQLYAAGTNLLGSTATTSWRPMGARPTAPRQVMLGLKVHPAEDAE